MTVKPRALSPIQKSRLHEDIVKQFETMIVNDKYAPGDKLPTERDLSSSFNVNRGTLREAIKKLELLGLVEIRHGDGIYVRDYRESGSLELLKDLIYMDNIVDPEILKSLLEVRMIMAREMAGLAAKNRSEKDMDEFTDVLGSDMPLMEKDMKIHRIIGKASGNIFYVFMLNFFTDCFRDFGHLYFDDAQNRKRSKKFHNEIYSALLKKESRRAVKIMSSVMDYSNTAINKKYSPGQGEKNEPFYRKRYQ